MLHNFWYTLWWLSFPCHLRLLEMKRSDFGSTDKSDDKGEQGDKIMMKWT